MSEYLCLLITTVDDNLLFEYAVKAKFNNFDLENWRELENLKQLEELLPNNYPIVDVRQIFEVMEERG